MTPIEKEEARLELALNHHKDKFDSAFAMVRLSEHKDPDEAKIAAQEADICDDIRHVLATIRAAKMARVREERR